jgi:hypothetical protein
MSETPGETQPETPERPLGDVAELEALSSKKAYEKFLPAAKAVRDEVLEECRVDVALVYHAAKQGVESVLAQEATLAKLPQVSVEDLRSLPQLAQGLAFAVLQLHRHLEAASFGPLFSRAQRLRRKLFKAADALAEAELLAAADAQALPGLDRGDVLGDCLALAALLRRNEAQAAGRSPVTAADLDEAEQTAARLKELLASGGDRQALPSLVEATQLRDRLWTLLRLRHDVLWRCGAWLYGREVEERVPPLHARLSRRPGVATAPRAQAVPAPAQLALARPQPAAPPREKPNPMRSLHQKIRSLVSVRVGRTPR